MDNDANDKKRPHWSYLERWMRARGKEETKDTINEKETNQQGIVERITRTRKTSPLAMVPVGYDKCLSRIFEISTKSME